MHRKVMLRRGMVRAQFVGGDAHIDPRADEIDRGFPLRGSCRIATDEVEKIESDFNKYCDKKFATSSERRNPPPTFPSRGRLINVSRRYN